jgi:UDP-GlcNAc3NAcA epimerase
MKILTIVGARPQFIKAAAVSRALAAASNLNEIIVHTGQHYDPNLSDVFFTELGIPKPGYNLGIGSGQHGAQTGQMLTAIEQVILDEKPDWLLVYGDTNSTLAGALAAAKLHVPVAHVEAGLRSFNKRMPEEINRIATDHMSTLLFAPTETAVRNLVNEGLSGERVQQVGDVMYDAVLHYGAANEGRQDILSDLKLEARNYILATIHRAENTNDPVRLEAILGGLNEVGKDVEVILPLHPRTKAYLANSSILMDRIRIIDPVGYLDMIELERNARLIATDSGGVQKEAYFHRVPCVTLRDETEWVELVEHGWNTLQSPSSASDVARTIRARLDSNGSDVNLYGGGRASEAIIEQLINFKVTE